LTECPICIVLHFCGLKPSFQRRKEDNTEPKNKGGGANAKVEVQIICERNEQQKF